MIVANALPFVTKVTKAIMKSSLKLPLAFVWAELFLFWAAPSTKAVWKNSAKAPAKVVAKAAPVGESDREAC
ncbi:hypothetical protein [Polaromonas sp.]|uniref:hypothetical protein n=1 Tax=Polaromonas sp. TaxID=1869339 RepID=UPI0013B5F87F|nr:hypothetical protein [Polaromonas sp.]NDP64875.1 hypothetical protein [Polaromonas sp.]